MTGRNRTHLPRREPGGTVDIGEACFDKLKLEISHVLIDADFGRLQQARSFLRGSMLQPGRGASAIKARSSSLLFGANIHPSEGAGFGTSLNLSLDLNLGSGPIDVMRSI